MSKGPQISIRRMCGYGLGALVAGIAFAILMYPTHEWMHAAGKMTPGHEELHCDECHSHAPGTFRQRMQANVQYMLGNRPTGMDLGYMPVSNVECLACHFRPKDNHPVFRFNEPKFAEAREKLAPQYCRSCHTEHEGKRVSMELEACKVCHAKLSLKKDPIDVPHVILVKNEAWQTCTGCHDFHGNHRMKLNNSMQYALAPDDVKAYFADGKSPYSDTKYYQAKRTRLDEKQ